MSLTALKSDDTVNRQSNVELLRIISFVLIVCVHSVGWYRQVNTVVGDPNWLFATGLSGISQGAVGCFMLISGYFYEAAKVRLKRILFPVAAYLPMYYLYVVILDYNFRSFSTPLMQIVRDVFTNNAMLVHFWYVWCLLIITCLSPLLKAAIDNISRKTHLFAIGIMLIFASVLPTVNAVTGLYLFQQNLYSNELATFVLMYFTGAYIRKYPVQVKRLTLGIVSVVLTFAVPVLDTLWCSRWSPLLLLRSDLTYPFNGYVGPFVDSRNLLVAAKSIVVFTFFTKLNFKSAVVNKIASLSYGAYLIHMFYVYLANYLVYRLDLKGSSSLLLLRWIAAAALALLTELARKRIATLFVRPR
jgi:surface polysaccharide O-acyltransferase-like enzyme